MEFKVTVGITALRPEEKELADTIEFMIATNPSFRGDIREHIRKTANKYLQKIMDPIFTFDVRE